MKVYQHEEGRMKWEMQVAMLQSNHHRFLIWTLFCVTTPFIYLFIYYYIFFMTTRIQSIDESRLWDIGAFTCLLEECPLLPFTKVILQVISNQNII